MSFEDIKDLVEKEEKRETISTNYLDLTPKKEEVKAFVPREEPKEVVKEKIVYVDRPIERKAPTIIEHKSSPIITTPIKKPKKKSRGGMVILILSLLLLVSIAVGAYNFYSIKELSFKPESELIEKVNYLYGVLDKSSWECFTDKCTEYYDKPTWLGENCDGEVCRFRYQNQDQSVLRKQLEEFPADHSIFCKSFSCDTQILRRAG